MDQRFPIVAVVLALLFFLIPQTVQRNEIWQSDVLVWKEAVAINPAHFHPLYNLGSAYARKGEFKSAEKAFQESSELNPEDDMSYAGLGYCCEMSQNWKCAVEWYKMALSLNPDNFYAAQGYSRVSQKIESKGS
jgi:tetratricopeptide (TPR) repeat protein